MPSRAKRPCRKAGCPELADNGYCEAHKSEKHSYDRWRKTPDERGYDRDWRKIRKQALIRDFYICQECLKHDRVTSAVEVHHDVPIITDPSRRLDLTNLISLCKPCHSLITATRDSSFARAT